MLAVPADVSVPVVRAAIYVRQPYDRDGDMVKVNQQTKIARREITGNGWTASTLPHVKVCQALRGGFRAMEGRDFAVRPFSRSRMFQKPPLGHERLP
jgi:hypothetical protein